MLQLHAIQFPRFCLPESMYQSIPWSCWEEQQPEPEWREELQARSLWIYFLLKLLAWHQLLYSAMRRVPWLFPQILHQVYNSRQIKEHPLAPIMVCSLLFIILCMETDPCQKQCTKTEHQLQQKKDNFGFNPWCSQQHPAPYSGHKMYK